MKTLVRRVVATTLAAGTIGAACGGPQLAAAPPVVVGPGSPASQPAALPQAPANPWTNRIACGARTCDAQSEVCCGFSSDYGCAPRVRATVAGSVEQRLASQIESCKRAVRSEYSFDFLGTCDDSTDCPSGQACCSQWLWSGASLLECIAVSPTGESVCDYGERCVADSCVTRGTRCGDGECRRADARVKCAGVVCGKDAPVCCQRGFEGKPACERDCKAADEDSRAFEFVCSGPDGCPAGTTCQAGMFGSYCARLVDTANAVTLCESDADCPKDGCAWMGKSAPPVCKEGHASGFTHCSCD